MISPFGHRPLESGVFDYSSFIVSASLCASNADLAKHGLDAKPSPPDGSFSYAVGLARVLRQTNSIDRLHIFPSGEYIVAYVITYGCTEYSVLRILLLL